MSCKVGFVVSFRDVTSLHFWRVTFLVSLVTVVAEADPEGGEGGSSPGQILNP